VRRFLRIPAIFHRAFLNALDHDFFNLAQAAAYSAIVALFPVLIVAAAIIAFLPHTAPIRAQLREFFTPVLPPDVTPLLQSYFDTSPPHDATSSRRYPFIFAVLISVYEASSVISTYMEGIRRSHGLPPSCWTFWSRRGRAFALVPLSLVPFGIASALVVFGHFITSWLAGNVMPSVRTPVLLFALLVRWTVALTGSVGLIALLYHMGTPIRQPWKRVLPGAFIATIMWFLATLGFGWYVTRFANYSRVYGSLGAAIALLFWLFIISLCVLYGAELNVQFHHHFNGDVIPSNPPQPDAPHPQIPPPS
jgi:membrane protein